MMNYTLCYLENEKQEYLMLHRVKKKNDINHDKWIGVGGKFEEGGLPFPWDRHLRLRGAGDPIPPPVHRHRLDWGDG